MAEAAFDVDVVIVGGGIHGVGVAQAAVAAGYSVLLVEKDELAHGTSSRSSKLIHGGLRYLETAQFDLVRESLGERRTLVRLAPELVHRIPFFVPIYRDTVRRPWKIRIGLSIYAVLAGMHRYARFRSVRRGEWGDLDGLTTDGLQRVFQYWDAQTDDARLTRAVARSAESLGATIRSGARFLSAVAVDGGYRVAFRSGQGDEEIRGRALVNAAGPWANRILDLVEPAPERLEVELVQGTHIEVPGKLAHGVYYTEAPSDQRAVFVMPWGERTLVGTTETRYTGDPDGVRPLAEEIDYLLATYRRYFPGRPDEVLDAWAGLRVLPTGKGSAFERRRDVTFLLEGSLLTIYGGKLTAYRASAEQVVRKLSATLPVRRRRADTAKLPLQ